MTKIPYTPARLDLDAFNCPLCQAFASQRWGTPPRIVGSSNYGSDGSFKISRCSRCGGFAYWINGALTYPAVSTAPSPNEDLPAEIVADYNEARTIGQLSPRGAAALLRLAIQKLCIHLDEPGDNINQDIASLVRKGLPIQIQQALDIVRVVGNNAVHPGQLELRDDPETVSKLFDLVNLIAEVMISQPKHIQKLYESVVPESTRDAIAARDRNKSA